MAERTIKDLSPSRALATRTVFEAFKILKGEGGGIYGSNKPDAKANGI